MTARTKPLPMRVTTSDVSLRPLPKRVERPDRSPVTPPQVRVSPGAGSTVVPNRKTAKK